LLSKLIGKIIRKPIGIALNRLIQRRGCYPIEHRQVRIEHHPLSPNYASEVLDFVGLHKVASGWFLAQ